MEEIVLAVDPSLRAFGYCVLKGGKYILDCGCIRTEPIKGLKDADSYTERIRIIAKTLSDIITKYKVDRAILETPMGSQSVAAVKALSSAQALTVSVCTVLNIPFSTIDARTVKKTLTGSRDAEKDEIMAVVASKFYDFNTWASTVNKITREAVSDSLAVYLASNLNTNIEEVKSN